MGERFEQRPRRRGAPAALSGSDEHGAPGRARIAVGPEGRRAAAVIARLERSHPHFEHPRLVALDVLDLVPDPAIARWVYARRHDHPKPAEITDRLRALGEKHPAIAAILTEPDAPPRFAVAPVPLEPLDAIAEQQLEAASRRYDGVERSAETSSRAAATTRRS